MPFEIPRSFSEGKSREHFVFGKPRMKPQFLAALSGIRKNKNDRFDDRDPEVEGRVFQAFLDNYVGTESARGETSLITDLRQAIESELDMDDEDLGRLRVCSTADTPLDYDFGTDALVWYRDPATGVAIIVKLDYTTNPNKRRTKADLILRPLPNPTDPSQEDAYMSGVERYAATIVNMVNARLAGDSGSRRAA